MPHSDRTEYPIAPSDKPGSKTDPVLKAPTSRQREQLCSRPPADWIDLPDGTFTEAGTTVRTAIVVFDAEPDAGRLPLTSETGHDQAHG